MYDIKLTEDELRALRAGNVEVLKNKLEESDKKLVSSLKKTKGDVAFFQGASHVIDSLLKIYRGI